MKTKRLSKYEMTSKILRQALFSAGVLVAATGSASAATVLADSVTSSGTFETTSAASFAQSAGDFTLTNLGTITSLVVSWTELLNGDPATGSINSVSFGSFFLTKQANGDFILPTTNIGAGTYALTFNGSGPVSADYSLTAKYNVAVVPEPETYGLMLAGLGVVGAVARRRGKKFGVVPAFTTA